jgi:heavy metal translocating P-type ATPase
VPTPEVGCVVLVMVTLGRWLEASGTLKANEALERLLPVQVRRLRGAAVEATALDAVERGDRLRVLAGERFPADGMLERGQALVDEQVLRGESQPIRKQPGDPVFGGTLNQDGELVVAVTATGAEGALARLIALVRQARAAKGPYERLADRVSACVSPALAAVVLATLAGHAWTGGLERGLLQALAVVLIACPCALGLATPLAVATALGRAACARVLLRSAESFERLATIKAVRFDKTGTLTTGSPAVVHFSAAGDRDDVLRHAVALAAPSTHVLSHAIRRFAGTVAPAAVSDVRTIVGRGVAGSVGEPPVRVFLGSSRLMEEQGLDLGRDFDRQIQQAVEEGRTLTLIGWAGKARGLCVFAEELRPCAVPALERCRALGLDLGVLIGDHAARGRALGQELGVPVEAGLLPAEKVDSLRRADAAVGPVAMVGDGINDGPALAASDLGIALGCGTDLARDAAALCLLGDDLTRLPGQSVWRAGPWPSSGATWPGRSATTVTGTVPVMVLTGTGASILSYAARRGLFRVAAVCVLLTGVLAIGRGIRFLQSGDSLTPACVACALVTDHQAAGPSWISETGAGSRPVPAAAETAEAAAEPTVGPSGTDRKSMPRTAPARSR